MSRRLRNLAVLALLALACAVGITSSGANFAASTSSAANSFTAAASFNTVAVALASPGQILGGSVALVATATSERGIERVRFESSPAGAGSWTTVCNDDSAPYSCNWNTAAHSDGARDLRAVATDLAGYVRSSAVVAGAMVDNHDPVPALSAPAYLRGIATLNASATDAGSGVATLTIAYRPASGGNWTPLCSGAGSSRSCDLAAAGLADGAYELRATATDNAGRSAHTTITRSVDNAAPTVSITAPGAAVRGTIGIAVTANDAGSGVASVRVEARPQSGGAWTTVCTDDSAPYECAGVDSTQAADGVYEARAIATDNAGQSTTSSTVTYRVDNTAPAVPTTGALAATLQGTVAITGSNVSDAGSGVAAWVVQYRPAGGGAWVDACSDTGAPWSCNWDTTDVADGDYDVRSVTRDAAGNETASAVQTDRRVQNSGPVVTVPPSQQLPEYLSGDVTLSATATDPDGIIWVIFERRRVGSTNWSQACYDTRAPFSCEWDTTDLDDGAYELRARATSYAFRTTTLDLGTHIIDNRAPRAESVNSGNGGSNAGRLEEDDWVDFRWDEQIAPASVLSGWDGSETAIRVEFRNDGNSDTARFWNASGSTRVNLVSSSNDLRLYANFITSTTWFHATMTQDGDTIRVTLGNRISGTLASGTAGTTDMRWYPSANATDLAGNGSDTDDIYESGTKDRDF